MRPPWTIILFTVLAGTAQGFFISLFGVGMFSEGARHTVVLANATWFALGLLVLGLAASLFHLGHPERAWRAVSQWRTSWLSREVLVLLALMGAIGVHASLLQSGLDFSDNRVFASGLFAASLCLLLWWCTGMIYAAIGIIAEWATLLTPLSFAASGLSCGVGAAAVWFAISMDDGTMASQEARVPSLAAMALGTTLTAFAITIVRWRRSHSLHHKSTIRSALGINHTRIRQMSTGMTGATFNTLEFFHGQSDFALRGVYMLSVVFGSVVPALSYAIAWKGSDTQTIFLCVGLLSQSSATLADRWLFFATVRHPQNVYYQC
jgi:sulfite dehydrogenase (quinone) subunit SoeC